MKKILWNKFCLLMLIIYTTTNLVGCTDVADKKEFNVGEIQQIAELDSLECSFVNIAYFEGEKMFFNIIGTREQYAVKYKARIKLGIDLKELEYDENKRTLYIPKAKAKISSNPEPIDEKYNSTWFGTRIGDDKIANEIEKSLDDLLKEVQNNESLTTKAQSIAANQLENLINNSFTIAGMKPDIIYILK